MRIVIFEEFSLKQIKTTILEGISDGNVKSYSYVNKQKIPHKNYLTFSYVNS